MKPNLIVLQPPQFPLDDVVESLCEGLCENYYVYLIRPGSEFRDDSPAGVRFLGHAPDGLPRFGEVAVAIAIQHEASAAVLRETYPESTQMVWNLDDAGDFSAQIAQLLSPTVVHGEFGGQRQREFARAM